MEWDAKKTKSLTRLKKRFRRLKRRATSRWAYVLVLLPAAAEWLDKAHPPVETIEILKTAVIGVVIGVCIWRLYRESDKLKRLAETDDLTGLLNRRRFNEDIEAETTRARRLKVPLTLLYVDVDDFKSINDAYGHAQGDLILQEAARFLRSTVRQHVDRCYRIGGDEFAVLMVGARVDEAVEAVQRRRKELVEGTVLEKRGILFSVGAVEMNGSDPTELVKKADRYMYAAKRREKLEVGKRACFAKL